VEWTGDLTGTATTGTVVMNGDKEVTANFVLHEYTLQVYINGEGTVALVPDKATYHYGDVVQLTATAALGWHFADWAQDLTGSVNPAFLTIDGDKVVVTSFALDEYVLDVNIVGQGIVTKDPDQFTYHYGDTVDLCETSDSCWLFTGWSGDASGTDACVTVTMDGHKSVTATFVPIEYTVTTSVDPAGVGTVTGGGTYNCGDTATLEATATNPCYVFDHWSGDLSGSANPATFTVDGDKSVTAHFVKIEYTLTTAVEPAGVGTVTGGGTYDCGDSATLEATATNPCYVFDHWTGALTGSTNPATFTVDSDKSVTAVFVKIQYTVTASVDPAGVGTVSGAGTYDCGDTATLVATATNSSYEFNHWSGALTGSTNPATLTVDGDKSVTAHFKLVRPTECTTLPVDRWEMVSIPLTPVSSECSSSCWTEGQSVISIEGTKSDSVTFGVNPDATDGFEAAMDIPNPPASPGDHTDGYFVVGSENVGSDIKAPLECEGTKSWTLKVQDVGSATHVTLSWDAPAVNGATDCLNSVVLTDTVTGNQVDMQAVGTYTYTKVGDPETREFTITVVCHCAPGAVFGNYIDPVILYQFNGCTGGYDPVDDSDVVPNEGYWLWVPEDNTQVCVTGDPVEEDSSLLLTCKGWHQISTPWEYPKSAILFSNGTDSKTWEEAVEAHWVEGALWQYDAVAGEYVLIDGGDTLDPWFAYWMLTYVNGLTVTFEFASAGTTAPMAMRTSPKSAVRSLTPPPPPPAPKSAGGSVSAGLVAYNEPNPVRDVHTTTFKVKGAVAIDAIRVEIFDQAGRLVFTDEEPGDQLDWHTENNYGEYLANGVYLYRVSAKVSGQWVVVQVRKLAIYR